MERALHYLHSFSRARPARKTHKRRHPRAARTAHRPREARSTSPENASLYGDNVNAKWATTNVAQAAASHTTHIRLYCTHHTHTQHMVGLCPHVRMRHHSVPLPPRTHAWDQPSHVSVPARPPHARVRICPLSSHARGVHLRRIDADERAGLRRRVLGLLRRHGGAAAAALPVAGGLEVHLEGPWRGDRLVGRTRDERRAAAQPCSEWARAREKQFMRGGARA